MPKVKVDHVISFSSEDSVHVANNVLSSDPAKKWKCKEAGERSATVVLQFEKACVISGIDIGNENSAYIEILVTRSEETDDYKVLLVMSSFMTPLEARQSINVNKVRMFTKDQLSKPECEQKWDRVKIVCTQPFNRHAQYGLSFITFHTPGDKVNGMPVQTTIGKFALRPDSPTTDVAAGSLFARRTELQKETLSTATAIRNASSSVSPALKPKLIIKPNSTQKVNGNNDNEKKPVSRNRNEILYNKDEEEPNEKIDKVIEKKQHEMKEKKAKESAETPKKALKVKDTGETSSKRKQSTSKNESPKKKIKTVEKQKKPFSQLLEGVTLVISGIQNPDRANLRTMALSMGAKYKSDWDNTCTHLICAFPNTPKFNQVKGKGKIVKRNWIEECHSQRKHLPWRRYCLDKNDGSKPESEDEIHEEILQEVEQKDEEISTDEEGYDDTKMQKRIKEIQAQQKKKYESDKKVFSVDTDDEVLESTKDNDISKILPDFLHHKTFFIDETFDEDVYKMIERYIIAYKGIITENPSKDVDYFITLDDSVESIKKSFTNALCLRPDWLWECHNNQKFVCTDDYLL